MVKRNHSFVWTVLLLVVLVSLDIICSSILSSNIVLADDTVASSISLTIPVACSLTATEDSAHSATINAGTYQPNIGTTTFKITCNDTEGYGAYAIGYANNEFGNTKLLATTGGVLTPTYDIVTGIGTNSTETGGVSNWAMKLTAVSGTYAPTILSAPNTSGGSNASFTNYHTVPSEYTKVVTYSSVTDTVTGSSFTATYAAYIATNQPAGDYDGKVRYTLVHPASEVPNQPHNATAGCISYWPNASGVADTMGDHCTDMNGYTNLSDNQADVKLWPTNFQRSGYGFAGWTDQYDYRLGASTNTGHIYGPTESITTPSDLTTNGLSLYAVWVKSAGNLQDWNGCSSLASGAVTALTDTRDNNTYAVAKLADGKCWMIENLRLGGATALDSTTINSTNTDNPASGFILLASQNPRENSWCNTNLPSCADQAMVYANSIEPTANMTDYGGNIYSFGNYYRWYSATAGTGTSSVSSGDATGSICPSGWHLPTGNPTDGEFLALNTQANSGLTNSSAGLRAYPNNFVFSGTAAGASFVSGGEGCYWSSTAYSNYGKYSLRITSEQVSTSYNNLGMLNGLSVRCVTDN